MKAKCKAVYCLLTGSNVINASSGIHCNYKNTKLMSDLSQTVPDNSNQKLSLCICILIIYTCGIFLTKYHWEDDYSQTILAAVHK